MIVPGSYSFGTLSFGGPGLVAMYGDAACATAIITGAASPPPDEACITTIITQEYNGDEACLTAILQEQRKLALRISNAANVHTRMGNVVTHEEISF